MKYLLIFALLLCIARIVKTIAWKAYWISHRLLRGAVPIIVGMVLILVIIFLVGCNADQLYYESLDTARTEYVRLHPASDTRIKNAILNEAIILGMTQEEVLLVWTGTFGRRINKSVGSWGVHEQWCYETNYFNGYLYFENGILTSWQN